MSHTVTLGWPPRELSPNSRCHWAKKAKAAKAYRLDCFYLAKEAKVTAPAEGPINLRIEFVPPSLRAYDADNCVAQIKAGLDGLAEALKVNDKRFVLHPVVVDGIGGMVRVRVE